MQVRALWQGSPLVAVVLGLLLPVGLAQAETAFFPRYPAISPDGSVVVFSAQGDLWRVSAAGGRAERLTAHPAYHRNPVFSPDGTRLAFASDREGSLDVYVMPAAGGRPERLTYAPSTDLPHDFSPDGELVYFSSARPWQYPVRPQIHQVSANGGTPFRSFDLFAAQVTAHPDGRRFLLTIGDARFGRVGYRGSFQADIWLHESGREPVRLSDGLGYDTDPMWGPEDAIYWRSEDDQTHAFNIWHQARDGANRRRLTDFRDQLGVRTARISRDGSRIVFEAADGLYILESATAEVRRLEITIAADEIQPQLSVEVVRGDASELAVAGGGEEIAMIVRGEIVLVHRELEGRATVVLPSPWREGSLAFRPGSADTLVIVSDREQHQGLPYSRIGLVVSDDPATRLLREARRHRLIWLTPPGVECSDPVWSPDGRHLAYVHGRGTLAVIDADGQNRRTLYEGWDDPQAVWSPDSRWLAFTVAGGPSFSRNIWLVPAAGGQPVNVSQHPDHDFGPVWNESGSMLAWTSRRYGKQNDVLFCYLTRADHERSREEWQIWEKTRDRKQDDGKAADDQDKKDRKDKKDKKDAKQADTKPPIVIDLEDIHLRVRRLTDLPGDERVVAIHPQGDRIAFGADIGGRRDLYTVDRFGEDRKALTTGGAGDQAAFLADDGKTVWLLRDGRPARVPLDGGELKTTSFQARLTTDHGALRRQVVEEGWRRLRDRFYDPELHGIDWPRQREQALRLAAGVDHAADFADVMNIMLGSLNASHMGYFPGGRGDRSGRGWLGLEFDPAYRGDGLRIARVVPHGPADLVAVGLAPGDLVLAVDDQPVGRDANFHAPLMAAGGDPVLLRTRRGREEREVAVRPVVWNQIRQRIYEADVKAMRERVEAQSQGRVGYIHIQGMGLPQVELFERDLYAAASGKEALVIDVRWNGGGWTTDLLLTILTQPVHAYTIPRGGPLGYPDAERLPLQRWNRPIAVICDESSYSNAEIFSHAIQTIGRGPVVGWPTGGNVISTGGWTTLDGGWIRLPMRGWYVWGDAANPERNNLNQEHGGCVPDHLVPLGPAQLLAGADPQLVKAVALMLEAADRERLVPEPAPRRPQAAR
jgi:tricorn protease